LILKIGKKPLEWYKPETSGKSPSPRYSHSMNYYEEGNYLIIHGGRNDEKIEKYSLNDTYVFDLYKFEWAYVKILFESPKMEIYNRFGHKSIIHSN
jgi:hypothetical protein